MDGIARKHRLTLSQEQYNPLNMKVLGNHLKHNPPLSHSCHILPRYRSYLK